MKGEVFSLGIKEPNHLKAHELEPVYNTTLENELEVRADHGAQMKWDPSEKHPLTSE